MHFFSAVKMCRSLDFKGKTGIFFKLFCCGACPTWSKCMISSQNKELYRHKLLFYHDYYKNANIFFEKVLTIFSPCSIIKI